MQIIARTCKKCEKYISVNVSEKSEWKCTSCSETYQLGDKEKVFEKCPFCDCRQFYIQKDFNQALGCLIMLVGIVLVPKTYGLSLVVFSILDWLLYRRIQTIVLCYKCGAEFKGFKIPQHLKSFLHHIGEKYDRK